MFWLFQRTKRRQDTTKQNIALVILSYEAMEVQDGFDEDVLRGGH